MGNFEIFRRILDGVNLSFFVAQVMHKYTFPLDKVYIKKIHASLCLDASPMLKTYSVIGSAFILLQLLLQSHVTFPFNIKMGVQKALMLICHPQVFTYKKSKESSLKFQLGDFVPTVDIAISLHFDLGFE